MPGWLLLVIIIAMLVGSVVIVWISRKEDRQREERRKRFELTDSGERVPLVDQSAAVKKSKPAIEETAAFIGHTSEPPRTDPRGGIDPDPDFAPLIDRDGTHAGSLGRLVNTPDGEIILTNPPFKLRDSIFSKRHGRYAADLMRRVPPWLIITPKVRLDTLLVPTSPDGRNPDDWRNWRRRVRLRSVDLLLCDRRTWKPILAIIFDREAAGSRPLVVAGGSDRMLDEIFGAVGLPFLRASGHLKEDWHVIRPYVEQAMLPTRLDEDPEQEEHDRLGGTAWDASAVVKLLRMDDEKGWMLE